MLVLLAACLLLAPAAQAEIRLNEMLPFDAIPQEYSILAGEMPPLPEAEVTPERTVVIRGLAAWNVSPEMMTDWANGGYEWNAASDASYDDQLVLRAVPSSGSGYSIPCLTTGDLPAQIVLSVYGRSNRPKNPVVSVAFKFETGETAEISEDLRLTIEKEMNGFLVSAYYDPEGKLSFVRVAVRDENGFGSIGSYELRQVSDCLTGEAFADLLVIGKADPEGIPVHLAADLPVKVTKWESEPSDSAAESPLPVLDPLPADALPEVWPAEYPDSFPAFSCERVGDRYLWTVSGLLSYGARINLPGETYPGKGHLNYYTRAYTLDAVPEDQIRILSDEPNGRFSVSVEPEPRYLSMFLEGNAPAGSDGALMPEMTLTLWIEKTRNIRVTYYSDGTTVRKEISMPVGDSRVIGEYGEDNKLK